jgi:hypothetical protein
MGDAAAVLPIMVSTIEARLGVSLEPTRTAVGVTQFACTGQIVEIEAEASS